MSAAGAGPLTGSFISLGQPLLYLALFVPLLRSLVGGPSFPPGDEWQVMVPALLVQLALFGTAFVGFGLIAEYRSGVIDRMRVTPLSRTALLLGRSLRDVVVPTVQGALLVALAVPFGLCTPSAVRRWAWCWSQCSAWR